MFHLRFSKLFLCFFFYLVFMKWSHVLNFVISPERAFALASDPVRTQACNQKANILKFRLFMTFILSLQRSQRLVILHDSPAEFQFID